MSLFQVYFLRDPEIDYSLGGVAGALDIPGLNKVGYLGHSGKSLAGHRH
jgi:hypothetical protein